MSNSKLTKKQSKIKEGLKIAYERMLEFKRQKGTPLVTMKDGKVIKVKVPVEK